MARKSGIVERIQRETERLAEIAAAYPLLEESVNGFLGAVFGDNATDVGPAYMEMLAWALYVHGAEALACWILEAAAIGEDANECFGLIGEYIRDAQPEGSDR